MADGQRTALERALSRVREVEHELWRAENTVPGLPTTERRVNNAAKARLTEVRLDLEALVEWARSRPLPESGGSR